VVPPQSLTDKREFYRRIAELVSKERPQLHGLEASDVEMISTAHPAIRGLRSFMRVEGIGDMYLTGNTLNGFYLPEGIVIRMAG
jgi:hypothetical protein